MSQESPEFWARAKRARDKLANRFENHPQVSLIDLGYDPENGESAGQVVLRVHVRQPIDRQALGLGDEIDGIPVLVVVGDYQAE
ncbi:MAG: hypothetical protein MOB07_05825 [Acidobacteria bacterium]|nr:hypothetical protein [Acidobacteriota bacterium]